MIKIKGSEKIIEWFGNWPSFHDSEIVELSLKRKNESFLKIHAWNMTNKVDEKGQFITEKHALVIFTLENITDLELFGFSNQNVISSLDIKIVDEGYNLKLNPCYGLAGYLVAKNISVEVQPHAST